MCVLTFPNYKRNYKCVSSQLYTTYILNFNMVDIVCAKKNSRVYIRHPDTRTQIMIVMLKIWHFKNLC